MWRNELTAADFADTGQWRLLLKIGATGLKAFLENTIRKEIPPQPLCESNWPFNRDELKKNLEDAVYNNPRLLDDFATRIIIYDPRTLFIPTEIAQESLGKEEELYKKVYTADDSDIMTDTDDDITAVWAPAPGIRSFLMRTFPGARISCNLFEKIKKLRDEKGGYALYLFARSHEADVILMHNRDLISASTQEWSHTDDLAFLTLNLLEIYNVPLNQSKISVKGAGTDSEAWKYIASKALSLTNPPENENNQW